MKRAIRIGVIGAGANTRAKHIPGFQAIPGVSVTAVCNRSRASGEAVAQLFGIPNVVENWRDIIDSPDIDAVCIGTWPNLHGKLATAALRAGKHVLTEARMARNLAEAEMMHGESLLRPKLVAQIVPAPMSLGFDATIGDFLRSGTLGSLREVLVTATAAVLADESLPLSWRQDFGLNGKNTLQLGIYYEMVLRWLQRGVSWVVADAAIFTKERRSVDGTIQATTIPESVTVLGAFAATAASPALGDGARFLAHCSGVENTSPRSEIRLHGSKAGLRLDLGRNQLWMTRPGEGEQLVEIAPEKRGDWRVEADFIESIREGKPVVLTDFSTGVEYMRFTEAVWQSWNADGERVIL